jgi:hypothetical protein
MITESAAELVEWLADDRELSLAPTSELRLRQAGWVEVRRNETAGWTEWKKGTTSGYLRRGEGTLNLQIIVKVLWPEDGANFSELYEKFEAEYAADVASVEEVLGACTYSSEFDEPPLPMAGQFDRGAAWVTNRGTIAVTFQHEDKEAPLRLSVWLLTRDTAKS